MAKAITKAVVLSYMESKYGANCAQIQKSGTAEAFCFNPSSNGYYSLGERKDWFGLGHWKHIAALIESGQF
jgi:hypothetical protein